MSSSYQLCPALQQDDGYLVVRRVEKAFPVFLRCGAAFLPLHSPQLKAVLDDIELCPTLADFAAAAARLVGQPMLRPFEGGVPILVYVARPGKEELFLEFAEGLDQADDLKLLRTLPPAGPALALLFGDPAVGLGPTSAAETAVHAPPLAASSNLDDLAAAWVPPGRPAEPGDDPPVLMHSDDLQPSSSPVPAPTPPADAGPLPSEALLAASTSALDDLLAPPPPRDPEPVPPLPDAANTDPLSEPALEILLRQTPHLQAPERGLGPVEQAAPEAVRGPAPEEVLAAVRQVVGALDEALRRHASEQQTALQTAMAAAEQRSLALEARQAEQWAQQQAALRQMHADQVAAIQDAILKLDDERSAWQQQALRQIQQASTDQLPAALRQLQDELAGRQQQTLNQLRDDLLRHQAEAAAAPAAPGAVPAGQPRDMVELNWQLENNAVSTQDLRQRVGQLLWVNVVLIVALVALALGAFWVLRGGLVPAPTPTSTAAPTFTPIPPTTVPPTPVPPTDVPAPTATQPPTATARPAFLAALSCANADRPRNFYDCAITNDAAVTDTLALAVQVEGEALNGFRPVVMDENQERITPDADTGLFRLATMRPRETRQVRVLMPCTVVAGCAETTFAITPLVDGGQTIVTDQIVYVTTHYFPPDAP